MIENQPLPMEGLTENRWMCHVADQEIVKMVAEKAELPYDPENWSFKVVHPTSDDAFMTVMARKDIPDEEKPSSLIVPPNEKRED